MKLINSKRHFRLFCFYLLYLYINCGESYHKLLKESNNNSESINYSNTSPQYMDFSRENNIHDSRFYKTSIINDIKIEIGEVKNIVLDNQHIYNLSFSLHNEDNDNEEIFIYFYPLDCKININSDISINTISNYEYDGYYSKLNNKEVQTTNFMINALINPLDNKNNKREFHLVINSFKKNEPLSLKEKVPSLFYFNEDLKLNLVYRINKIKNNNDYPIILSFFIKEKAKFKVDILLNETLIKTKSISYIDNIIIPSYLFSEQNISIKIEKVEEKDSSMIVRVIEDNISPFYLPNNLLYLGFMPSNFTTQYFYMEILKGDEGEIMLYNKRFNGNLKSYIVKKSDVIKSNFFKNAAEYFSNTNLKTLEFDEYSQKLNFSSSDTKNCEDGCYLLIIYDSKPSMNITIKGTEFSLLCRIWDEEEYTSQIINIPLEEYIFGTFYNLKINHYYSVYLPDSIKSSSKFQIEIHYDNVLAYAKKGIIKININKPTDNTQQLIYSESNEDLELIFELNKTQLGLESLENQYISLVFEQNNFLEDRVSYYYFRIIQLNNDNNIFIYPLDTNKENLCITSNIITNDKYSCYFLIKNSYNEFSYGSLVYAYGKKEVDYRAYYVNNTSIYSIDIKSIIENTKNDIKRQTTGYIKLDKRNEETIFILLEIISYNKDIEEKVSVFFNFYSGDSNFNSIDIYSYHIFYYNNYNYTFDSKFNFFNEYKIFINITRGRGSINFSSNENNEITALLPQNYLSFTATNKKKNKITFFNTRNLAFSIKIFYFQISNGMEDLNYRMNKKDFHPKELMPNIYYIQDKSKEGIDINLDFHFPINSRNDLYIEAYAINFYLIKLFNDDSIYYFLDTYFYRFRYEEIYDNLTKSALINFDLKINEEYYLSLIDRYFIVFISLYNYNDTFPFDAFVSSKNDDKYMIPHNQYIRGSFSLINNYKNQTQIYFIQINEKDKYYNNEVNRTFILEFSSNIENIKLVFNEKFKPYDKKIKAGIQQYFFNINNIISSSIFNFTVQMNNSNEDNYKEGNFLTKANYIFKLYETDHSQNHYYIFDKEPEFKFENNEALKESNFNLLLKFKKIDYYFNYTTFISLFLKEKIYKNEILNTTAKIFSEMIYSDFIINNDTSGDLLFKYTELPAEKEYVVSFFIEMQSYDTKSYYSFSFDFDTKNTDENDNKKIIKYIIIGFSCLLIVITIIFILIFLRYKTKNKKLEEKVQAISFSAGIDDSICSSKGSKVDEDYETTFI